MSELSPQAQAVLDAAYALPLKNGQPNIAAALRAAVRNNIYNDDYGNEYINANEILAIVTELENLQ